MCSIVHFGERVGAMRKQWENLKYQSAQQQKRAGLQNVNEVKVHFTSSWTDVQLGTKPIGGGETKSGQFKCTTY